MRVAALYDIHGNLPALEAVLEELPRAGVDRVVVGGDVVPGPMVREALDRLLSLDIPVEFIVGNGEVAVLTEMTGAEPPAWYRAVPEQAREIVRWQAQHLSPEVERILARWPKTVRIDIEGLGAALFCHATPRDENEVFTRLTPDDHLLPVFEMLDVPLVVCGHTHMQFDRTIGPVRVVNAGSVGMPFGDPGADWLLLGPDVQFRHTPYDLANAAERVRATDYLQAAEFAERYVLRPPSAAEMLDVFTRAAETNYAAALRERRTTRPKSVGS